MRIHSIIPLLALAGCVSVASLHGAVKTTMDANSQIVGALDALDAHCQASQHDEAGLKACRDLRDQIRAALREQVAAFGSWAR